MEVPKALEYGVNPAAWLQEDHTTTEQGRTIETVLVIFHDRTIETVLVRVIESRTRFFIIRAQKNGSKEHENINSDSWTLPGVLYNK